MPRTEIPLEIRYWEKVDKLSGHPCWLWTGAVTDSGYGVIGRGRRGTGNIRATHVSWKIHVGSAVPRGKFVLHRCDNPQCVNPEHLFIGTALDNHLDARKKGRWKTPPTFWGADNCNATMTPKKIRAIRRLLELRWPQQKIADAVGVSKTTVARVFHKKSWAHVS